jgi:hypothetical protein
LAKRGKGRFSNQLVKIPLYPPLPKGDKNNYFDIDWAERII